MLQEIKSSKGKQTLITMNCFFSREISFYDSAIVTNGNLKSSSRRFTSSIFIICTAIIPYYVSNLSSSYNNTIYYCYLLLSNNSNYNNNNDNSNFWSGNTNGWQQWHFII